MACSPALHYDLIHIGGSWAQRQVFNITMIQAAINIRTNKPSLALSILAELKCIFVILKLVMKIND